MRSRTRAFAVSVYQLLNGIRLGDLNRSLARQLLRSATSVAANYSSATRGRSEAEFYSKLCIVVEECDEALFWLDFLLAVDVLKQEQIRSIKIEAEELLSIFSTIRKKLKNKKFPAT
ncbi:MAG: four helix bundle protein [Bacteroidetes bacterium]|nr:four helix bundle protein [Bacteroidota bacterium]